MDDDLKKLLQSPLGKYSKKMAEKPKKKTRRKNKAPEKQVVKQICAWLKSSGFSYDIVEASSFDRTRKVMVHDTKVTAGFSDIVACDPYGFACYIEAKAPGKRSTLRDHQRQFLMNKIENNAFACVTDSVEHLNNLYFTWILNKLKKTELCVLKPLTPAQVHRSCPKSLLLDDLPNIRQKQSSLSIFDEYN